MWPSILQPGLTSTVVDFTHELALLTYGLLGLVGVSAGAIVFMAVRYHLSQPQTIQELPTESVFMDYRDAA
ncbi:MAG: hypothetical protein AB7P18_24555 [Candidatus Binatia bacterium]